MDVVNANSSTFVYDSVFYPEAYEGIEAALMRPGPRNTNNLLLQSRLDSSASKSWPRVCGVVRYFRGFLWHFNVPHAMEYTIHM